MKRTDIRDTAAGGTVTVAFNLKPGMNFALITPPGNGSAEFKKIKLFSHAKSEPAPF